MTWLADLPATLLWDLRGLDLAHLAVIAVICGLMTEGLIGVLFMPAVGAAGYWMLVIVLPPLVAHDVLIPAHMRTPSLDQALALYVAFLAVNTVVYALKKLVTGAAQ